jgi:hypothetical protein
MAAGHKRQGGTFMNNQLKYFSAIRLVLTFCLIMGMVIATSHAIGQDDGSCMEWGKTRLINVLEKAGYDTGPGHKLKLDINVNSSALDARASRPEGFHIAIKRNRITITGFDAAGALYGCLDLAQRIQSTGRLPEALEVSDRPSMNLRGTCILLMKLGTYNYPITPEEFPFFYDKTLWLEYLDFLAENRFNYIAFWNGHPFDYFVKLERYPEAQEGMEPGLLERNHDMLYWLCREGQKRNIRFMFEFYNIHTSVYFQKAHNLPDETRRPTPLLADYTSHCIEQFVSEFPDVGLYICAGEALDKSYQEEWLNEVIYPAVLKTGKKPPIMLRSWYVDLENAPNLVRGYPELYIERKFNVEMIAGTEIDPENAEWAKLTRNFILNIHCIANLEPFRWNPPSYIQKIIQNSIDAGSNGLHLYPRKAWRWPYGCEIGEPELQWHRDAFWFEMWGRYAWNAERNPGSEKEYWLRRLTDRFGTQKSAEHLLASFEIGADVLPAIQRLFWLDHDNHYVVAAGGKLSHFEHAPGIPFLPLEDAMRIEDYLQAVMSGQNITELNPETFLETKISEAIEARSRAASGVNAATQNIAEAKRFETDAGAVEMVVRFYLLKLQAAAAKVRMEASNRSSTDHQSFITKLEESVALYRELAEFMRPVYESISDVPANIPERLKICPYHWSDILPLYERELQIYQEDFRLAGDPGFTVPSLPGLAGIRYADAGFMNARTDYSVSEMVFDFEDLKHEKNWSAEWFGYLKASVDGTIVFTIGSDRGASLSSDGKIIVAWQGEKGEKQGELEVKKGRFYPIRLAYDRRGGLDAYLSVQWSLNGGQRTSVPPSVLFHSPAHKRKMDKVFIFSPRQ